MSRSSIQETVGVRSRLATWFSISCTVLLAIFLLASSTPASGQSYFGTVGGIVTDQTGAVLPGTEITLVDQEKGYKFHATTDNAGRYLFRAVSPGLYTVIADMAGFEKGERTNIRVNVTQNPTANLSLKVASGTETVEVKADAERLDQHDATTGLVVNRNFINDLPLLDRSVMDLTMLTPGVTTADDQCVGCGGTNFVSNGSRNATSDILMDGVSVTNMEPNGGVTEMTYAPSSEAVEEFRVEQSNFSAEYGFSGASVVNMITRSGTNSFHGSGYDFIRNNIGDANTWFNNYSGYSLPVVHRNNFGFTVGGPVWKNKTFFFFDYDAKRESGGGSYQAGVPSTAERAGDFGEVCTYFGGDFDSTGKCTVAQGQIWDPYTGVKGIYTDPEQGQITGAIRSNFIPYNNIATYTSPGNAKLKGTDYALSGGPGNLIDPAAKKMMSLFPSPTPNLNGATIYHNWYAVGSAHYPNDQFDVKIDHRLNQKNLISGKYSQQKSDNTSYNCFKNFADPCAGGPNWSNAHLFTINDVHTFSDKMLLTTTFGVTRGAMRVSNYNGMEADPLAELGMPEYLNSNGFTGVPGFSMGNYWSAGTEALGGNPWGNYKQGKTTGQVGASVSRVFGAHELKFGFEARQHIMNYIQTESPNGVFDSGTGGTSACPGTWENCGGDGMASFMMGQFSANYEIQMEPATEDRQYAGFVQENWKFSPKLTFNIGLRYDVTMPKTERFNRQNWFDKTAKSVNISGVGQAYGGDVFASSHQRRIVDTDWRDIQPRFGFAYQFTPKTTVRGGYGMYYSQSRAGATGVMPYGRQGYTVSTDAITTYKNDGATPYLRFSNPFPSGLNKPAGSSGGVNTDLGLSTTGPLRSMTDTPYEQSWSFGIEREVPYNIFLTAIYAGKKGTHLYFAGLNGLNHLGKEIESYTNDQINDLNASIDNPFIASQTFTNPNSPYYYGNDTITAYQLKQPYWQFPQGLATEGWPTADSHYHSLQLMAEKRYSNGMQFLVTYVWSKSIDDSSVPDDNTTWLGSFTSLQDPNRPELEKSLSTFDIPSVFQASYIYELPIGRGKAFLSHMPTWLNTAVGGWKTNGVWRVSSGRPLSFTTYNSASLPTYSDMKRPNLTGKPHRSYAKHSTMINAFFTNPDVFVDPADYKLGSMPRATSLIRSPLSFTGSASMEKLFSLKSIRDGMNLELRLEADNPLNHPVFGSPDTGIHDDEFGQITYTSNGPRQIQLGVKVTF